MSEIRPCPFCGNRKAMVRRIPRDGVQLYRDRYAVLCPYWDDGCGAEGGWRTSKVEAVAVWNERRRARRE